MVKDIKTRNISRPNERELWGRAAGRCEFDGCSKVLYKSQVTQERVHLAEKAHIYSFSRIGPRGHGPLSSNPKALNRIDNLILVCHDCHLLIDQDKKEERYSAALLQKWKFEHEKRVRINTGIRPSKISHVLIYGSNIGDEQSNLSFASCADAMLPDWNPADDKAICLSMCWEGRDSKNNFWQTEENNLLQSYSTYFTPFIKKSDPNHYSVFALAPQPLLIRLGTLITDKLPTEVYQLHREPADWKWRSSARNFRYLVKRPSNTKGIPVLVISLSARIIRDRLINVLTGPLSIWEITIKSCNTDFLQSKEQLMQFRQAMRMLISEISNKSGNTTPLHIFPAMPVACAVELGRIRMPKTDMPWIIYDQNNSHKKFIQTLTIGN